MKNRFRIAAAKISALAGSALVFVAAAFVILVWAASGPVFNFSNTWQLVINTGTTIVTFLMVFLIQNTQNRDGLAMQLKLDELIRAHKMARARFVSLEDFSDNELMEISNEFKKLGESSPPTSAIHKLHKKIEEEHANRKGLVQSTEHFVESMLEPLSNEGHK